MKLNSLLKQYIKPRILRRKIINSFLFTENKELEVNIKNIYISKEKNQNSDLYYFKLYGGENIGNIYISPWKQINLKCENDKFNMIVEIPKGSNKKIEMMKDYINNPLTQEIKKNKITSYLRYNKVPFNFNYGFLPKTWEDNTKILIENYKGDNDPIDVIEISETTFNTGDIVNVEILGALCLIDQKEVDYKILAINTSVKNFDFSEYVKNKLPLVMQKLKYYKMLEGKKENSFIDKLFTKEEAIQIIMESHKDYKEKKDVKVKEI